MTYPILQPPIPYADHHFTFNPQLRSRYHEVDPFSHSPPMGQTPSPELFTAREADKLLSFLDGFDRNEVNQTHWDVKLEPVEQQVDWSGMNTVHSVPSSVAPYSNPHLNLVPNPSAIGSRRQSFPIHSSPQSRMKRLSARTYGNVGQALPASTRASSSMMGTPSMQFAHLNLNDVSTSVLPYTRRPSSASPAGASYQASHGLDFPPSRAKPLLSTPQKRLNHIMSEQKRRNAIRDGYAQLIGLLAPEGSGAELAMPTRGRPKGSGTKGKQGKGHESEGAKGKSGVLFRAVEYCHWLEEGRNALKAEVERLEAAAGIFPS
ncbi:hypothetical protein GYMLUDRAFT_65770 [Collybiopsis luxurians FD-317 M1]|nr:hypothetical protein GYMLUDRAFT_65770 [Collybiopsis luxurians FD-317 M1]